MKQRITLLSPEGAYIDIKSIKIDSDGLNYTDAGLSAGIEQRTTLSLSELPKKIRTPFERVHELHIRWSASSNDPLPVPLVSRLPAGLHVFFTPRQDKQEQTICQALKTFFDLGLKCSTYEETFSKQPILSERFASSATYQYFHEVDDAAGWLSTRLSIMLCGLGDRGDTQCQDRLQALRSASQIDIDYDVVSHALVTTVVWSASDTRSKSAQLQLPIVKQVDADGTIEVGVLAAEKADEPEELKLGGYLTVVGEDVKPAGTLFSFPSRHHPLPEGDKTRYKTSFLAPTGLHPTMAINFAGSTLLPPDESCALHAYLTLPSALFIDRYQLSEAELLASKNIRALRALSGADDLEAPDWTVKQWGSAALLELRHPAIGSESKTWQVEVPLHLRYLQSDKKSHNPSARTISAPWPVVFWACEAEEGLKMSTNPFDRVNLGYDGLFGPKTMFYHIPASGENLTSIITVPTLDPATISWLPYATLAVVVAGFTWVLWSLIAPLPKQKHAKKE